MSHLACFGEGSGVVDGMSRYLVLLLVLAVFHQQFFLTFLGRMETPIAVTANHLSRALITIMSPTLTLGTLR